MTKNKTYAHMVGYCHIQPYVATVHRFAKQGEVIKKDGGADTKDGGVVPFPIIHFVYFLYFHWNSS